jgi:hypothetical protein
MPPSPCGNPRPAMSKTPQPQEDTVLSYPFLSLRFETAKIHFLDAKKSVSSRRIKKFIQTKIKTL